MGSTNRNAKMLTTRLALVSHLLRKLVPNKLDPGSRVCECR